MSKAAITTAIEQIIKPTQYTTMFNDKRKKGIRLKFGPLKPLTQQQIDQLLKLPYVTKVGYADLSHHAYYNGPTVYLSKRLSEIIL